MDYNRVRACALARDWKPVCYKGVQATEFSANEPLCYTGVQDSTRASASEPLDWQSPRSSKLEAAAKRNRSERKAEALTAKGRSFSGRRQLGTKVEALRVEGGRFSGRRQLEVREKRKP